MILVSLYIQVLVHSKIKKKIYYLMIFETHVLRSSLRCEEITIFKTLYLKGSS